MKASDYRARARRSLDGKWGLAVGTTFVAALLGGISSSSSFSTGSSAGSNFGGGSENVSYYGDNAYYEQSIEESISGAPEIIEELTSIFSSTAFASIMFVAMVFGIVAFILGGATRAGLCRFNKNLYYNSDPKFKDIFTHYDKIGNTIVANLLITIFTVLWTLLFIIPGIIATYSYSMTFYILDENPDMSARDAIRASKQLMKGHKWELFCLQISFFGWAILAALTLGIGGLFLTPYTEAATYAFFNQIAHGGEEPAQYEDNGYGATTQPIVDVLPEEAPVVDIASLDAPIVEEVTENDI